MTKEQRLYNGAKITKDSRTSGHSHAKNVETDVTTFTKFTSKWLINLNVMCKTIRLEYNIENLNNLGYGNDNI